MDEVTIARPELQAHDWAMRTSFADVVKRVEELLTSRLVAYLAGVQETRAVHEWAGGQREVRSASVEARLRLAGQVAVFLADGETPRVVQAWFQGLNPYLDDRSPARLLREGEFEEVGPEVIAAARAFALRG